MLVLTLVCLLNILITKMLQKHNAIIIKKQFLDFSQNFIIHYKITFFLLLFLSTIASISSSSRYICFHENFVRVSNLSSIRCQTIFLTTTSTVSNLLNFLIVIQCYGNDWRLIPISCTKDSIQLIKLPEMIY